MKLLYCQLCGDIIAPYREALSPRKCVCGTHAVWWKDVDKGILRVCDTRTSNGWPVHAEAYVIGLTNIFLGWPDGREMTAAVTETIIDAHEKHYLFKQRRSPVIRIRPGESGDTQWERMPD